MREKGMKNIAIVFLIAIAVSVLAMIALNFNTASFHQELERERKQSALSDEELLQMRKEDNLNFHYLPKIDSIITVDPKSAVNYIDKVSKIYPKEYSLNTKRGVAYYKVDSFKLAAKEFKASMKIQGWEQPRVLGYLAWCYIQLEDYDSAIVELEKASKESSDYSYDWDLAGVYKANKNPSKALETYRSILKQLKEQNPIEVWKDIEYVEGKISDLEKR